MATRDMTEGKPARLLITFALPMMLGSVFQQMYTLVDAAVVGQAYGVRALASVGAADWINWLMLGTLFGFTQGFSIWASQRFGAHDFKGLRQTLTTSIRLTVLLAAALTVVGILLAKPLFTLLNTPLDIVDTAYSYLFICICGMLVVGGYNLFSSILRALGDSKNPLIAMIIASLLNIGLDLLFVLVFDWGVQGAAVATVFSQFISCLYCLICIGKIPIFHLEKEDWKRDPELTKSLIKLGTPTAAMNAIIGVGGLGVQYVINGFGSTFLAGYTATNKLYGILEMAAIAYGYGVTTYCGQNLGAKKTKRIRHGVNVALLLSVATALSISAIMILFGKTLLRLFISQEDPAVAAEALRISYSFLCYMAGALFILYLLYVYRAALQGMGNTVIPMISGFVELAMRIGVAWTLPGILGETGVYYTEVAAWTGAMVLQGIAYYHMIRHLPQEDSTSTDLSS